MKINDINIGDINKRVQVMQSSQVKDGAGGFEKVLTPIRTVWANITPVQGREFWESQQTQARITHKIIIRYTKDINRTMVLVYDNRIFDIQFIINVEEKNRFLEIQALERQ